MTQSLVEKIKDHQEDTYQQFVEKYGDRINEQLETVFIKNKSTCWSVGVYQDKKDGLVGDIYEDTELNGGRFNNLLRYCKEQGFSTSARYWCGNCYDALGFVITV